MENPQEINTASQKTSPTDGVVQKTVESVEDIRMLKLKVASEIQKEGFPDLVFLFSPQALGVTLDVLKDFLNEEKTQFQNVLQKKNEDLVFDDFLSENLSHYFFLLLKYGKGITGGKEISQIVDDFEPLIVEFENEQLFESNYYDKLEYAFTHLTLDNDQKRLLELRLRKYKLSGIDQPEEIQKQIKDINIKLTQLKNAFQKNNINSKNEFSLHFINDEFLKGIPKDVLESSQQNAEEARLPGYIFDQNPNSYLAIMKYCHSKETRKQFYNARQQFASSGTYDNRGIILEILQLREQKAQLLGYQTHADLMLTPRMAQNPSTVLNLIEGISHQAKNKLTQEIQTLKEYFGIDTIDIEDLEYYATKYKEEKYAINEEEIKQYFEYKNVLGFMFEFAEEFFSIEFKKVDNISLPFDEMSLYEVFQDGKLISYFFLDPYFRKGKKGGAWADNPRGKFGNKIPVIINACNFQQGNPALLDEDAIVTLFHEFGHALHEILSQSPYAELSGFQVAWDFVELPSQLLENWGTQNECLARFARHYQTGESLPQEIIDTLSSLKTFMSGQWTLRQNEFALTDMYLHTTKAPQSVEELDKFILEVVNKFGYFPRGDDYKAYASFSHIFSSEYDAGYYSYMWAEMLEADVFERIKELGMFDSQVGKRFVDTILGQGCRKPEAELFKDFMGRELDSGAFMRKKGLV